MKFNLLFSLKDQFVIIIVGFLFLVGVVFNSIFLLVMGALFLPSFLKRIWRLFHFYKLKRSYELEIEKDKIEIPFDEIISFKQPNAEYLKIQTKNGIFVLHKSYIFDFKVVEKSVENEFLEGSEFIKFSYELKWFETAFGLFLAFWLFIWIWNTIQYGFYFDIKLINDSPNAIILLSTFLLGFYYLILLGEQIYLRIRYRFFLKKLVTIPLEDIKSFFSTQFGTYIKTSNKEFYISYATVSNYNEIGKKLRLKIGETSTTKNWGLYLFYAINFGIICFYFFGIQKVPEQYFYSQIEGTLSEAISFDRVCDSKEDYSIKLEEYPESKFFIKRYSKPCSSFPQGQYLREGNLVKITIPKSEYISLVSNAFWNYGSKRAIIQKFEY